MIILDTNVVSEMMRPNRSPTFNRWFDSQAVMRLFTTAITEAEIRRGLALMPLGKKRSAYLSAADAIFSIDFANRVLPFDGDAAPSFADIALIRQKAGRPIATMDALIAAVARAHGAAIATRNGADFDLCGVTIIDPWKG